MTPDERFEADEKDRLLDTVAELRQQLAEREALLRDIANRTKDQCAALCYEHNWLIHGEEMSALILATKEVPK